MATELARKISGTRKDLGKEIKNMFVRATQEECEPLTFGDLEKGDKFIIMPVPGDNRGHGGFLSGFDLLVKVYPICHPVNPANAISFRGGSHIFLRDHVFVIKID